MGFKDKTVPPANNDIFMLDFLWSADFRLDDSGFYVNSFLFLVSLSINCFPCRKNVLLILLAFNRNSPPDSEF